MGGFLSGLLDVLGGPNQVKNIENNQFDFKKMAQDEFLRQQQRETARQANEKYGLDLGSAAAAGAPEGQSPDVGTLFPGADQARRRVLLDALVGASKDRKANLEDIKANRDLNRELLRGQNRLDVVGATGTERRTTNKETQNWQDTRQPSPRDEAGWNSSLDRALTLLAAKGDQGGAKGGRWAWNTRTNAAEWVSPEQLSSAPPGMFTDPTSGRQGASAKNQAEGMSKIVANLDASLANYEKTQTGVGRYIPSAMSPTKAVAWDRYKASLQSAGQAFGRKVLNDTRVSNEDRIAYAKTIGQTSELMTVLDPTEARRRAASMFESIKDYETKYGGGDDGAGTGTPNVGDEKTFPNGRIGVWDGSGWKAK